jgi:hypothetical protein
VLIVAILPPFVAWWQILQQCGCQPQHWAPWARGACVVGPLTPLPPPSPSTSRLPPCLFSSPVTHGCSRLCLCVLQSACVSRPVAPPFATFRTTPFRWCPRGFSRTPSSTAVGRSTFCLQAYLAHSHWPYTQPLTTPSSFLGFGACDSPWQLSARCSRCLTSSPWASLPRPSVTGPPQSSRVCDRYVGSNAACVHLSTEV